MAIKHNVVNVGGYIDDPNSDDAYTAFSNINEAFKTVVPATGLPILDGGTGATTAAEARTNLGLGNAATSNLMNSINDASSGRVMTVGAFGWGQDNRAVSGNIGLVKNVFDSQSTVDELARAQIVSSNNDGAAGYPNGIYFPAGSTRGHAIMGASVNTNLYHYCITGIRLETGRVTTKSLIRTSANTTVDSNGFLKNASPIVELYADKIELNDEAKLQNITFEKLGTGDYLIKGSSGLAQSGWYVEQPKDSNGNIYHAVVYGTLENGDISVKTYEQKTDGVKIVADLDKPVDIKENRFISIRLNELPNDTSATINPTFKDIEGNPAPSYLHELEEGVWVISDENAVILEQERLAAMPVLKRRQFRLTLAMNGYDLKEIEALIDQIEDPMQRTIAQIEWQDATDFERTNPTLLMMASKLGLDTHSIDELWNFGLTL